MKTECPKDTAWILKNMPTDEDIDLLKKLYGSTRKKQEEPQRWGDGIVWSEFHSETRYPDEIY